MRALIILPASLLVGCIVVPHHHSRDRPHSHGLSSDGYDDWQDNPGGEESETDRGLREGLWRFDLSDPDLHGDCTGVDLGTTEATLDAEVLREDSALVFLTDFGNLYGEQVGPEVGAFGTVEWEGAPIELELEAEATDEIYLDGLILGWSGPCLVAAQVAGTFVRELP